MRHVSDTSPNGPNLRLPSHSLHTIPTAPAHSVPILKSLKRTDFTGAFGSVCWSQQSLGSRDGPGSGP